MVFESGKDNVKIYYLDFGNLEDVPKGSGRMRKLPAEYGINIPMLAIPVKLKSRSKTYSSKYVPPTKSNIIIS